MEWCYKNKVERNYCSVLVGSSLVLIMVNDQGLSTIVSFMFFMEMLGLCVCSFVWIELEFQ